MNRIRNLSVTSPILYHYTTAAPTHTTASTYTTEYQNVTDRRTDRQTDRITISISRVSVLTRDKNGAKIFATVFPQGLLCRRGYEKIAIFNYLISFDLILETV